MNIRIFRKSNSLKSSLNSSKGKQFSQLLGKFCLQTCYFTLITSIFISFLNYNVIPVVSAQQPKIVCKTSLLRCQARVARMVKSNETQIRRIELLEDTNSLLELKTLDLIANLTLAEYDFNQLLGKALACDPNAASGGGGGAPGSISSNYASHAVPPSVPNLSSNNNGPLKMSGHYALSTGMTISDPRSKSNVPFISSNSNNLQDLNPASQAAVDQFNNWLLMETAVDSYQMHVAFNDLVTTLVNDVHFNREIARNRTMEIQECAEDINTLLIPGNDPTKLRAALLNVQQQMREKTKMAGRAKAKFDRLVTTCQSNLQNLNKQYLAQSSSCTEMRMKFGQNEEELRKEIQKLRYQIQTGKAPSGMLAGGGSTTINLGGGGLVLDIGNALPGLSGITQPSNHHGNNNNHHNQNTGLGHHNNQNSNDLNYLSNQFNFIAGPNGEQLTIIEQLNLLSKKLHFCNTNRTKLETFLADRVSDNAKTIQVDAINTEELALSLQEKESNLLLASQQNEVMTKEMEVLQDSLEKVQNDNEILKGQLDITKISLNEVQSEMDGLRISNDNFQEKLTEKNGQLLQFQETCSAEKTILQEEIKNLNKTVLDSMNLKSELETAYAEVDACNIEKTERGQAYNQQKSELQNLKREVKDARTQVQVMEFKYEHEKNMRTQKHNKLEAALADMAALNETILLKTMENDELLLEISEKEVAITDCKVELQQKTSDMGIIQLDMFNQQTDLMRLNTEVAQYKAQVSHAENLAKEAEEMKLGVDATIARIDNEKEQIMTDYRNLEQDYKAMRSVKMVQEVKISELEDEIKGYRDKVLFLEGTLKSQGGNLRGGGPSSSSFSSSSTSLISRQPPPNELEAVLKDQVSDLELEVRQCNTALVKAQTALDMSLNDLNIEQILQAAMAEGIEIPCETVNNLEKDHNNNNLATTNFGDSISAGEIAILTQELEKVQLDLSQRDKDYELILKQKNDLLQDLMAERAKNSATSATTTASPNGRGAIVSMGNSNEVSALRNAVMSRDRQISELKEQLKIAEAENNNNNGNCEPISDDQIKNSSPTQNTAPTTTTAYTTAQITTAAPTTRIPFKADAAVDFGEIDPDYLANVMGKVENTDLSDYSNYETDAPYDDYYDGDYRVVLRRSVTLMIFYVLIFFFSQLT